MRQLPARHVTSGARATCGSSRVLAFLHAISQCTHDFCRRVLLEDVGTVTLTWDPPLDPGGVDIAAYTLYWQYKDGAWQNTTINTTTTTDSTATLQVLGSSVYNMAIEAFTLEAGPGELSDIFT